uniref:Ig-like domain-containing protein n=1 Tax=Callorhinchus milii TaxID=7868 RepID=A0A4W3IVM3_CALMI
MIIRLQISTERCSLLLLLSFYFWFPGRCGGDGVTQLQTIVTVTEGEDVSLQCNYTGANTGSDYLFWYRHLTNKAPEYILRTSTKNRNKDHAEFAKQRFSASVSQAERTVPLNILQVRITDSAGYYCALSPTEAHISGSALQKLPCGVLQLNGYSTRLTSERLCALEPVQLAEKMRKKIMKNLRKSAKLPQRG